MRILLFGDGAWAAQSLSGLLAAGHSVEAVILRLQPTGSELIDVARHFRIRVLQPAKVNDAEFVSRELQPLNADLGISIAYNQIFRPAAYAFLRAGLINFHAGKLPFYRGRNIINWAILNGEKEIGLTSHFVDSGIDTGAIILQQTFPIGWTDRYGDVLNRVVAAFPEFVVKTVQELAAGAFTPRPQSDEEGTYFPGRGPEDEWLDWGDTSFNLHNKIRGISHPAPGARTWLGESEVRIWRAFYDPSWPNYIATPGVVLSRSESGVRVKTGDSVLSIEEIQVSGSQPERPRWRPGTKLGVNLPWMLTALKTHYKDIEHLLCSGAHK